MVYANMAKRKVATVPNTSKHNPMKNVLTMMKDKMPRAVSLARTRIRSKMAITHNNIGSPVF